MMQQQKGIKSLEVDEVAASRMAHNVAFIRF